MAISVERMFPLNNLAACYRSLNNETLNLDASFHIWILFCILPVARLNWGANCLFHRINLNCREIQLILKTIIMTKDN